MCVPAPHACPCMGTGHGHAEAAAGAGDGPPWGLAGVGGGVRKTHPPLQAEAAQRLEQHHHRAAVALLRYSGAVTSRNINVHPSRPQPEPQLLSVAASCCRHTHHQSRQRCFSPSQDRVPAAQQLRFAAERRDRGVTRRSSRRAGLRRFQRAQIGHQSRSPLDQHPSTGSASGQVRVHRSRDIPQEERDSGGLCAKVRRLCGPLGGVARCAGMCTPTFATSFRCSTHHPRATSSPSWLTLERRLCVCAWPLPASRIGNPLAASLKGCHDARPAHSHPAAWQRGPLRRSLAHTSAAPRSAGCHGDPPAALGPYKCHCQCGCALGSPRGLSRSCSGTRGLHSPTGHLQRRGDRSTTNKGQLPAAAACAGRVGA